MKLSSQNCGKILYELTCPLMSEHSDGRRAKDTGAKELDKIVKQFILFLTRQRMLKKIKYIMNEFISYAKEQKGIVELQITSARGLSKSEVDKICKNFGQKVEVETKIDATLLGGVVIKDKNRILDASLKTQLQKFKRSLI